MILIQNITLDDGRVVQFIDRRQNYAAKCQPRDIELQGMAQDRKVIEEIVIDIRKKQLGDKPGIARGMLWD